MTATADAPAWTLVRQAAHAWLLRQRPRLQAWWRGQAARALTLGLGATAVLLAVVLLTAFTLAQAHLRQTADPQAVTDDLWHLHHAASGLMLALALALGGLAHWRTRRRQRRLRAAVNAVLQQTRSVGEAGYRPRDGHTARELQPLSRGVDELHQRMRALFGVHAEQIEALRRQAHSDPLTGLPNRRHFLAVLDAVLNSDAAPAEAGLVLLRLPDLQGLNQRRGAEATDELLKLVADTLASYPRGNDRCVAGRLSGGDFALLLPAGGLANDTAQSLQRALHAQFGRWDHRLRLQVGVVELKPPLGAAQALVMAQAALVGREAWARDGRQAQAPHETSVSAAAPARRQRHHSHHSHRPHPHGPWRSPAHPQAADLAAADSDARHDAARHGDAGHAGAEPPSAAADQALSAHDAGWRRRLARALVQGRVRLGEFPVCSADGQAVLLDCPLRVQFQPDGPYEPARRWLGQATRSRLNPAVDEKAVALALAAIAEDGRPRCVNVSAASAQSTEFLEALDRRLAAAPQAAAQLWLDLPESLALWHPQRVRSLCRRWHAAGAHVALEHCGEQLMRVPTLVDLGLDCVRIDSRFVNGIAAPQALAARNHLDGLVRLVRGLGLQVTAEGVRDADDLALLWEMGFHAATGPALPAEHATV